MSHPRVPVPRPALDQGWDLVHVVASDGVSCSRCGAIVAGGGFHYPPRSRVRILGGDTRAGWACTSEPNCPLRGEL